MGLIITITSSDQLYNCKRPRITAHDWLCAVIGGYITDQNWLLLHCHITTTIVCHHHHHPLIITPSTIIWDPTSHRNLTKHRNAKVGARAEGIRGGEKAKGECKWYTHHFPFIYNFYSTSSANRHNAEGSPFSVVSTEHRRE